jgi:hypothetical protein
MVLIDKRKIWPVLILVLLCPAADRLNAAEPSPAVNELEQARAALARIQTQQRALEARAAGLLVQEQQLGALVGQLKQQPSGLSESLQQFRLDRALRQLRDRLVELQTVHREQRQLNENELKIRGQIAERLRVEANQLLAEAEHAFKAGQEQEANALYRRSLERMYESERMAHAPAPPVIGSSHNFDPVLTGTEAPEELVQISVLLRHEAEEIEQELKSLDQLVQRIQADLVFERRAARFQGIRERSSEETDTEQPRAAGRETELEGQLEAVQTRITEDRMRLRHFLDRAQELEGLAASREQSTERLPR